MKMCDAKAKRWLCLLQLGFIFTVCVGSDQPRLVIFPEGAQHGLALRSNVIMTCKAEVDSPERITDLKWWGPKNQVIPENANEGYTKPSYRVYADTIPSKENSLGLFLTQVEDIDSGHYNCTATYAGNLKLRASVELYTYLKITWTDTPTSQYAIMDSEHTIKCHVNASPQPIVDWLRNKEVIQSEGRYVISADGLVIKSVTMKDEGVYTCRARVIQTGELDQKDIRLEVQVPPNISGDLPEAEVVEGETAVLSCKAEGKPDPTYTWINRKGEDVSTLGRYQVDKYKGVMTITNVQRDDGGKFKCTARNRAGSVEKSTYLTVILKPHIDEFLNVSVKLGVDGTLTCKASGEPLPDISFRKLTNLQPFQIGIQQIDERIMVELYKDTSQKVTVARLSISELQRSDDGLYLCTASNKGARSELTGHLTVEFPPSFANTPMKEAWSWINNPVNLTCLAESIPNATIAWDFQGRPIPEWNYMAVDTHQFGYGPLSTLKVTPRNLNYFGPYSCRATNKHGEAKHDIVLREARVPGQILQVAFETVTATTITFKFIGPSENGGQPIQAYAVEYKLEQHDWNNALQKIWPIDIPYILENLEPMRTYNFRFSARNNVGFGVWSSSHTHTMPKRSFPEEPKILIGNTPRGFIPSPYPDRYELRWSIPADNGDPIDVFQIVYYPVQNTSQGWKHKGKAETVEVDAGTVVYDLVQLNQDTFYRIELRAHNSIGDSSPAEMILRTAKGDYDTLVGPRSQTAFYMSTGIIVAIVVLILVVILIIVDICCCCFNRTGLLWLMCGTKPKKGEEEALPVNGEKEPLKDIANSETVVKNIEDERVPIIVHGENGNTAFVRSNSLAEAFDHPLQRPIPAPRGVNSSASVPDLLGDKPLRPNSIVISDLPGSPKKSMPNLSLARSNVGNKSVEDLLHNYDSSPPRVRASPRPNSVQAFGVQVLPPTVPPKRVNRVQPLPNPPPKPARPVYYLPSSNSIGSRNSEKQNGSNGLQPPPLPTTPYPKDSEV